MGIQRTLRRNLPTGMVVPTKVKFFGYVVGLMVPVGSDVRIGKAFEGFMGMLMSRAQVVNMADVLRGQAKVMEMMDSGDWSGVMN